MAAADFAIVGATLIDGTGAAPVLDSVMIVRGGRIEAGFVRSRVTVQAAMRTIEARGSSVLPGLWEMHAHFAQTEWSPAYLAAGVTSGRDCGGEFEFITAERDAIERGSALGPSLLLARLVDSPFIAALLPGKALKFRFCDCRTY